MRITQAIKKGLFGSEEKIFRIRRGLGRNLKLFLNPTTQIQRILGLEEIELSPYFKKFVPYSKTFVDIGAAYGFYTIAVAFLNDSITILWCDGWDVMKHRFDRNLEINKIKNPQRIKSINKSIGKNEMPLDQLLENCEEPMLCKIDVEGNELDVLESGQKTLIAKNCTIILETHSLELENSCNSLLQLIGFKTHIVKNAWWRFIIPEGRPMAHNRWIIAEKK